MKKTILITGGAGFIGAHLAKKLIEKNCKTVLIDRLNKQRQSIKQDRLEQLLDPKDYIFYNLELSDYQAVKKIFENHRFDIICHLAAKTSLDNSVADSGGYEKTNILATMNIFELAREFAVPKVILASSSMVYGKKSKIPFKESADTDHPLSLYAATKKSGELIAHTYHHLYGIDAIVLRFFTVYGPWLRPKTSMHVFTEKIIKKEPIEIQGFGKIARDFSYIDDIIGGVIAAIDKKISYGVINLGSGKSVKLEKIVKLIERNLGIEAEKKYVPMQAGDLLSTRADIKKAKKILNCRPTVPIEKGIAKFITWYREYYKC